MAVSSKAELPFFSYSGSLSDKRFMFTSNGKNNGLIFACLFKYFLKTFEKQSEER